MTVVLEFRMDEQAIRDLLDPPRPTKAGKSRKRMQQSPDECIRNTSLLWGRSLLMPVRFAVDGQDLFDCGGIEHSRIPSIHGPGPDTLPRGHLPCHWAWLPVVYLATEGLLTVERIPACPTTELSTIEYGALYYRRHGSAVEIAWVPATGVGPVRSRAVAEIADLQASWAQFSEAVRTTLVERVPALTGNRNYGLWFAHGRSYLHPTS